MGRNVHTVPPEVVDDLRQQMNRNEAFDKIHDEAVRLLSKKPSEEIRQGLELIVSLTRYQFDVRSAKDKSAK